MSFSRFVSSAPGKIILTGEHAVVYGTHAVATVVDRRTYAEFAPLDDTVSFHIDHPQLSSHLKWSLSSLQDIAKEIFNKEDPVPDDEGFEKARELIANLPDSDTPAASVFLMLYIACFGAISGVSCRIVSTLPIGAGLGSSASFSASLATGFVKLRNAFGMTCSTTHNDGKFESSSPSSASSPSSPSSPSSSAQDVKINNQTAVVPARSEKDFINEWAYIGERLLHGNPSGVDNSCSVYGGAIVYRKGHDIEFLSKLPDSIRLLVTDTKVSRNTKQLVAGVADLYHSLPAVMSHILKSMDELAIEFIHAIKTLNHLQDNEQVDESTQALTQEMDQAERQLPVLDRESSFRLLPEAEAEELPASLKSPSSSPSSPSSSSPSSSSPSSSSPSSSSRGMKRYTSIEIPATRSDSKTKIIVPPKPTPTDNDNKETNDNQDGGGGNRNDTTTTTSSTTCTASNGDQAVQSFLKQMNKLLTLNQHLLAAIGVNHPAIDKVINVGSKFNLLSKLTGAGGGGCVISALPLDFDDISYKAFESQVAAAGMSCFTTSIGQYGAVVFPDVGAEQCVPDHL